MCSATKVLFFFSVSSFFSSSKLTWFVPQSNQVVKGTLTATSESIPVKTFQGFVEYLCGIEKTGKKGSNRNLVFRKACLRLLEDNDDNRNATAKKILTWLDRLNGDKATNQSRLDSFTAGMRSWLKFESDLTSVDLGANFNTGKSMGSLGRVSKVLLQQQWFVLLV